MADELELDLDAVKKRTVTGIAVLVFRNYLLSAISLVGFTLITIYLKADEFGIFILVSAIVDFFGYFSDVGLAAALVQKHEKPTISDFRSTFTIQQLLVTASVIVVFALSPFIKNWNHLSSVQINLLYAVAIGFWLSSLKSIPSVILERKLEFQKIVAVQLVENILFYFSVVFFAYRGFGVTSYTIAVPLRSLVGVILLYTIAPWPIGYGLDKESLRHLFRFGIPYQINTFLALIKDRLMTILLGRLIGPAGIGFAGWAEKWASLPLRNFMDPVNTVTFPAYSRLQKDKDQLSRLVSRSLFFITSLVFPTAIGMVILSPWFVILVPKYLKWQPALLALSLYAFSVLWSSVSTHLTNLLNAVGRIRWTFYLMIFWTILTWALTPALAVKFGFTGVALSQAIIGSTSFLTIWLAKKEVNFSLSPVLKSLLASLLMAVILVIGKRFLAPNWASLIALTIGGGSAYVATLFILTGGSLVADAKSLLVSLKKS
jgi:O-antigen/teichoic acid export membrane protein